MNREIKRDVLAWAQASGTPSSEVATLRSSTPGAVKTWAAAAGYQVLRSDLGGADESRCPACGQFAASGHACPGDAVVPTGDYGATRGDDRTKQMLEDLESAVQAVVASGQLQQWLDSMSSNGLNRWSWNNRMLAIMQLMGRDADISSPHLMGFRQWQDQMGRRVKKGAKAVWILAPIVVRKKDADDGDDERRVVGFKSVPVFNVDDTEGDPLPDAPVKPAAGEATPGTLEGLRQRVGQAGYQYRETEIPGCNPLTGEGTQGYTDPRTKEIVIDSRLSPAHKASVIAHELGHVHCGHVDDLGEYRQHRGRMETEAEMSAYLVTRSRGMHRDQVDAFSPGYIASWSKGDPAVLKGAMDKATKAYNKIIDGDWPTN